MAERRAKGLCYNYDEQFISGHYCKRLFWLEVLSPEEQDDAVEEPAEPEIFLHALTGFKNGQTMQIKVSIVATQLGLIITQRNGLQVIVANGERVPSPGMCADC